MKTTQPLYMLPATLAVACTLSACGGTTPAASCYITTGGTEYHYPDFTREQCDKEVQSLIDKGIVDASLSWK